MARNLFAGIVRITVVISVLGWGIAWAQGSYSVPRYTVISSSTVSGGGYTARSTIGQEVTSSLSGGEFTVNGGFWSATAPHDGNQIFLPTLQR
jgi:hypothetical protein